MADADFFLASTDQLPSITAQLLKPDKTPMDLTGCTIVFRMQIDDASTPTISGAGAIVGNPTQGNVQYDWAPSDTLAAGTYNAEWVVTVPGGKLISFPNDRYMTIEIRRRL